MIRTLILCCNVALWLLVCLLVLAGCGGGDDDAAAEGDTPLQCPTVSERGSHAHGICPVPLP